MIQFDSEYAHLFPIMSRDEVRALDHWAIEQLQIPGVILMENAGYGAAQLAIQHLQETDGKEICIFSGTGNNGGDGLVMARHFLNAGISTQVVICGDRGKIKGDAKINLQILENMKGPMQQLSVAEDDVCQCAQEYGRCDLIVDALFGTGLSGPLREDYAKLVDAINDLNRPVLAVDIPSGLDCDTGEPLGSTIHATLTATFAAIKKGFLNPRAKKYTGQIHLVGIGIDPFIRA